MTLLQILAVLVRDSLPEARVHNITDRYLNMLRTEHLEAVWEDGFANQDPRDWAILQRSVLTPVYYMLTDHPNLHHIFPRDFCENNV